MQTQSITLDRGEARTLFREYKKHLHYSQPIDREVMRAYQLLAQGRLVIKAIESVVAAGVNEAKLPKLAICRADAVECRLLTRHDGSATMTPAGPGQRWFYRRSNAAPSKWVDFPAGSFPLLSREDASGMVPPVPLHLRPKRGLANYHILWEAEWTKVVPRDPYLLRRIGEADMWLVVAMWDLTEVERAALAARIASA